MRECHPASSHYSLSNLPSIYLITPYFAVNQPPWEGMCCGGAELYWYVSEQAPPVGVQEYLERFYRQSIAREARER